MAQTGRAAKDVRLFDLEFVAVEKRSNCPNSNSTSPGAHLRSCLVEAPRNIGQSQSRRSMLSANPITEDFGRAGPTLVMRARSMYHWQDGPRDESTSRAASVLHRMEIVRFL